MPVPCRVTSAQHHSPPTSDPPAGLGPLPTCLRTRPQTDQIKTNGIIYYGDASCEKIELLPSGERKVTLGSGATIVCDQVMLATGRAPNTRGLGLEAAGVELGPHGEVVVDDYSRTSAPSVWAVGDVTNRKNLTPVATMEGVQSG